MSEEFINFAQIASMFWPPLILLAGIIIARASWQRRNRLRRVQRGLLAAWLVLLPAWLVAWFGRQPAPKLLPEPVDSLLFLGGLSGLLAAELVPLLKNLQNLSDLTTVQRLRQVHAIEELNSLTPSEFEKLVQETYRRLGYTARHVGQSGDHGVDLEVRTPHGEHWVVQCKRWRDSVGEATIRELFGTMHHEGADRAVMVTSAEITIPARIWARGKPIDLVDGPALITMLERARRLSQPSAMQRLVSWLTAPFKRRFPPPTCPRCRVRMVQRPRRPTDHPRRKTYRCANYPDCRVVVVRHS